MDTSYIESNSRILATCSNTPLTLQAGWADFRHLAVGLDKRARNEGIHGVMGLHGLPWKVEWHWDRGLKREGCSVGFRSVGLRVKQGCCPVMGLHVV